MQIRRLLAHVARHVAHRAARVPGKACGLVRASAEAQVAAITLAITIPLLAPTACNLPPAEVATIVDNGIRLACASAVDFVPPSDTAITAKVCQGVDIGADALSQIIAAAAANAKRANLIQPQAETTPHPVALTCAGKPVAWMMSANASTYAATLAQGELSKRKECAK